MKSFKIYLIAILFTGLFTAPVICSAQADVYKDIPMEYVIGGETVSATSTQLVYTPSGNILWKVTLQLPPGNPMIPEKGVYKASLYLPYDLVYDIMVFSDGRVTLVFHT